MKGRRQVEICGRQPETRPVPVDVLEGPRLGSGPRPRGGWATALQSGRRISPSSKPSRAARARPAMRFGTRSFIMTTERTDETSRGVSSSLAPISQSPSPSADRRRQFNSVRVKGSSPRSLPRSNVEVLLGILDRPLWGGEVRRGSEPSANNSVHSVVYKSGLMHGMAALCIHRSRQVWACG